MLFLGILVSVEVTCFQEHHFTPNSFSVPPENIRNLWFSDISRGYRKKIIAWNGLFGSISLKFQVKLRHAPFPFILFIIHFQFISYFWCFTLFYFSGKYSDLLTNRHQTPRVTVARFPLIIIKYPLPKYFSHFVPLVSFYTPWKHQKTSSFLIFSRGYKKRTVAWNVLIRWR